MVFRRQGVGAEIAGDDVHRAQLAELAGNPQHLHFSADIEAVTRLDLDRRNAFRQ